MHETRKSSTFILRPRDLASASTSEYSDNYTYTMKNYEQSLSTNIVSETQLGYAYQSHPATTAVCGNKSTNPMYKCYYFEPSGVYSFRKSGQYATGELSVTKTTDADNRTSLVFFRLARQ